MEGTNKRVAVEACEVPVNNDDASEHSGEGEGIDENTKRLIRAATKSASRHAAEKAVRTMMGPVVEATMRRVDEKYGGEIKFMKEELVALRKMVEEQSRSDAGSVASTSASTGSKPGDKFIPEKIEVRICKFKEKEQKGYAAPEVANWLQILEGSLAPEVKSFIDGPGMTKANSGRYLASFIAIRINMTVASDQTAWSLKKSIEEAAEKEPRLKIFNCKPKIVVQSPPWKEPFIKAGGKALNIFQEEYGIELTPQWSAPFAAWKPHPVTGRPTTVVTRSATGGYGYDVNEANLQLYKPDLTVAAVTARLAQ